MSKPDTTLAKKDQQIIEEYLDILDTGEKNKIHERTKKIVGLDDGIRSWQDIERVHDLSIISDILDVMIDEVKTSRDAKLLNSIGRIMHTKNAILQDINPAPKRSINVHISEKQDDVTKTTIGSQTIDVQDYEVIEDATSEEKETSEEDSG